MDEETGNKISMRASKSLQMPATKQSSGAAQMSRRSQCSTAGLGVTGVLLLILITGLCVKYTNGISHGRDKLLSNYSNLTQERYQLLNNYTNLTMENDKLLNNYIALTMKNEKLLKNYSTAMQEKEELLIKYNTLTQENDRLQANSRDLTNRNNQLQSRLSCSGGRNLKCYLRSNSKNTWFEARQVCRNNGADLVTIESSEEQNYIVGLGNWVWIGLYRSGYSWAWVNGRSISTRPTFWEPGQPNTNTEHCAMTSHTWQDYPCSTRFYSICEKSAY